ncbi:putative oxidoreductase [Caenibius tardaugens NBRC 16725]|uniref:Putative oxidoreductase n=1 Tax=Caenibius tardaugens NBRC 16725 TaxID=1219035 RepID=U2YI59_9SPHN|nr:SDR family oxidoreductase [Caenibius tardaugens]GAD47732.1 putative oxidoreductase [Caenibius tardaugens NBRC 16725]
MHGIDYGIAGRKALVCGSSRGLGHACAVALAQAGADVTLNGRDPDALARAADDLAAVLGHPVAYVIADATTAEGRAALLDACPEPDILVNNAAGPPPGQFTDWDEADWQAALAANMIAPIMLIRTVVVGMQRRGWGRIINITSGAVKAPIPLLGLSNGARSGLTGFVAGLAREVARDGVTINNLLPGQFETDRLRSLAQARAASTGATFEQTWQAMAASNPTGRLGRPEEFGATCAFLASQQGAYINGQNILLDGGAYPGTF